MRTEWVKDRKGEVVTQVHYAKQGEVTPEMARVAEREHIDPRADESGCEVVAEFVKKSRADFIAEVLLIAVGPFPNIGKK